VEGFVTRSLAVSSRNVPNLRTPDLTLLFPGMTALVTVPVATGVEIVDDLEPGVLPGFLPDKFPARNGGVVLLNVAKDQASSLKAKRADLP
jgi:hypothetical protein